MINSDQLKSIANFIASQELSDALVPPLRQSFPDIHFSYGMDDDVYTGKPVLQAKGFNLYLIDSSEECLSITQDECSATGLLVAETFVE